MSWHGLRSYNERHRWESSNWGAPDPPFLSYSDKICQRPRKAQSYEPSVSFPGVYYLLRHPPGWYFFLLFAGTCLCMSTPPTPPLTSWARIMRCVTWVTSSTCSGPSSKATNGKSCLSSCKVASKQNTSQNFSNGSAVERQVWSVANEIFGHHSAVIFFDSVTKSSSKLLFSP